MYRVLVAEDEQLCRKSIEDIINKKFRNSMEVVIVQNGAEAVEIFDKNFYKQNYNKQNFQLVLLDIDLPVMDGLSAAELIRARDKECGIILIGKKGDFSTAKRAIRLRVLNYILKPICDKELIETISEAITLPATEIEAGRRKDPAKNEVVIGKVSQYIENHYTENISLKEAAEAVGYSDAYFCKMFKESFNMSFISYLNSYRTKKALELLDDVTVSIKDISTRAGYRDANYFTRIFKRTMGVTPSEYRERVIKGDIDYVI
jgi:YesN/AraC family two-component response regulator